jgi:tetratricopeptide (TPR) repeat protein
MLHWGAAMTYFQPLWPGSPTKESLAKGVAAIQAAKANAASATPLEKELIDAGAAYYADAPDTATRYKNWEVGQRAVAEHFPKEVEAQAFWALSRLATVDKKDKTYKTTLEIAATLEELLKKRPEHPGLLHYLLHAYDNPVYAQQAVNVTKTYEAVSPDAAHALHMPSHIHVRLGNWKEVIDWNIKSATAALKHPVNGRVSRDWLHATDYMVYGYLNQGDDAKAKEAADKIDPKTQYELNSGPGAYALAATPARMALERRDWKAAAALVPRAVDYSWDGYPWAEAVTYAAKGLAAARLGDKAAANAAIKKLDELEPKIESTWWQGRVEIERDVIKGWLAYKAKSKDAEALFVGAATKELAAGKDSVEPGHVITAAEELADFYMETKQPAKALEAYQKALKESPKRFNALAGAARAADAAKLPEDAKRYYAELLASSSASSTRPERAKAQQSVPTP